MNNAKELTSNKLKVKIYNTRQEMGKSAAWDVAASIQSLLEKKPFINMIFAAAPSQNEFLQALSQEKNIDWSRIHAFHMDEYIGLKDDAPQRFGNFLKKGIFDRVPFKEIFYINGNANDPQQECERYSSLLKEYPVDIVCMGIGENGHIAFNDPHVADFNDPLSAKVVELSAESRCQQVHDGCFPVVEEVPAAAITLTIPALLDADIICCVVPGSHKAEAVYHTLYSDITPQNPATILRTHGQATLYLDKDSASEVNH
ncbi:MAG: glucosamine-6-phosphate deaminase [Chitinophagaceae bacterium]|nr:glucosamine-6-phosphate deaminase [Chitinophagaceae bacterium]